MLYLVQGKVSLSNQQVKTFRYTIEVESRITTTAEFNSIEKFIKKSIERDFECEVSDVANMVFDIFNLL